jgi:hypothetical protein
MKITQFKEAGRALIGQGAAAMVRPPHANWCFGAVFSGA